MPRTIDRPGEMSGPGKGIIEPRHPARPSVVALRPLQHRWPPCRRALRKPCNGRRIAMTLCDAMSRCCALSCLCLRARCGERRGKQESILRRCTADARRCTRMGLSPARGCTVEPERNTLVSRAGAVVHVRSACIGVHPFCICVKPFLGCLRRHAPHRPACQVARRDPASQTRRHPVAQVETAGPSRPDFSPVGNTPCPAVPASPVVARLPASAMPHAAKTPCTYYSAQHDDGGPEQTRRHEHPQPAHTASAPGARWGDAGRPMAWRQKPMHLYGPAPSAADRPPTPLLRCPQRSRWVAGRSLSSGA